MRYIFYMIWQEATHKSFPEHHKLSARALILAHCQLGKAVAQLPEHESAELLLPISSLHLKDRLPRSSQGVPGHSATLHASADLDVADEAPSSMDGKDATDVEYSGPPVHESWAAQQMNPVPSAATGKGSDMVHMPASSLTVVHTGSASENARITDACVAAHDEAVGAPSAAAGMTGPDPFTCGRLRRITHNLLPVK